MFSLTCGVLATYLQKLQIHFYEIWWADVTLDRSELILGDNPAMFLKDSIPLQDRTNF